MTKPVADKLSYAVGARSLIVIFAIRIVTFCRYISRLVFEIIFIARDSAKSTVFNFTYLSLQLN
jgi:hypothetical protein